MTVLRAGTRVRLTTEGAETFPNLAGVVGRLEGYNAPGLARVLFDGRKSVIELDASYLMEIVAIPKHMLPARRGISKTAIRNADIAANRKILTAAFKLVRFDPAEKKVAGNLLDAIAGQRPVTASILETAKTIIAMHANAEELKD